MRLSKDAKVGLTVVGGIVALLAALGIANLFTEADLFADISSESSEPSPRFKRIQYADWLEEEMYRNGFTIEADYIGSDKRALRLTIPACNQKLATGVADSHGKTMREIGIREVVCDNGRGRNWRARP